MIRNTCLHLFLLISLASCFGGSEIRIKNFAKNFGKASANVSSVSIVNDQLIINGSSLDGVTGVRVTGPSSFDHTFAIESQTSGNLVANGLSALAFAMDSTFNLILTDAEGAASFPVTFTLVDGSVTAQKLDQMGAGIGQVLKWNGTTWVASDLGGLTYAGNWHAGTNTPDLLTTGNAGEYYIVNNAGTTNLAGGVGTNSWAVGDWVVWNDVLAQWEKIDNATNVTSFNGRNGAVSPQSGDYTWAEINKTTSSLSDIANVEVPTGDGSDTGKVLKWNNATSTWEISDDLSGGGAGSVTSTEIANGSIVDADVNASAAIAQSKINGLTTDLAARLPLAGGTMTGDITFSGTQTFDGVDVSNLSGTVGTQGTSIAANTAAITGLDTDDVSEATNLYFTTARARTAAVLNTTAGTETDQAPSVAAMKSYVSGLGAGDILDGGNTEGAAVTIGTNDAQSLNLETNNSTAMTILNGGNVGIGTTIPSQKLNVSGGGLKIEEGAGFSVTSPATLTLESYSSNLGDEYARIDLNGGDSSAFYTGARISSTNANNLSSGDLQFFTKPSGGSLPATPRMVISPNGNVGIGATTPDTKLEVDGTLKIADGGETCTIAGEAGMIRYNTGNLEYCNGSAWQTLGVSGSGLSNFNGETGGTQTLATGTTGTAPAFVSATNTHTLNIPLASGAGVTSGTISKTDYDSFAAKQAAITTGATTQYLRGDLSLSTFGTDVLGSVLTGYSVGAGTVAATDTVLQALQKLDGNVAAISVPSDTDGLSEGSTNLYFTNARARTAAVLNTTAGTETDQAPSVAAMKSYVTANAGAGDILNGGNTTGAMVSVGTNDSQELRLETNGTSRVTILPTGNVGIGIPAATAALDVKGTNSSGNSLQLRSGENNTGTDSTQIRFSYSGSTNYTHSLRTRHDAGSEVGNAMDFWLWDQSTDALTDLGSLRVMSIVGNGRVGIGASSPDTQLEVAGTLKIADGGETCTIAGEAGMIRYSAATLQYCNGSSWQTLGVSGAGLTTFNGQTGSTQTLANGATGTAPAFVSGTDTHTLNIPLASGAGVTSGTISKTDYDSFAAKQAAITTGATTQYLRGDLSLSTFGTDVTSSVLTGYSAGAGTVAATDTVLQALQKLDGNVAAISVPSDTDGLSEGATNLYFTNTRARTAAVLNTTAGTETDQAPSVAAMKSYVTANAGTGDILDGGNTTGSAVTIGTNDTQSLNLETNNSTAMTILDSGNVGIGTTSPSEVLSVAGTANFIGNTGEGAAYATRTDSLVFTRSDIPTTWKNKVSNSWNSNKDESTMNFELATGAGTTETMMTINANGDVGIGTTDPSGNLDIKGNLSERIAGTVNVASGSSAVTGTGTSFDTILNVGDAIQLGTEVFTVTAISSGTALTIDSNHTTGISTTQASYDPTILNLTTGDSKNLLNVDKSGLMTLNGTFAIQESSGSNVINLRSPASIASDYTLTLPVDDGDNGEVLTTDGSGVLTWATAPAATSVSAGAGSAGAPSIAFSTDTNTGLFSGGADVMSFAVGGAEIFSFSTSGIVSPTTGGGSVTTANGTAASPTFSFAGDTDTGWYRPAANELAAATGGSERVRIDSSGNVGIGTTAPEASLHLDGAAGSRIILDNAGGGTGDVYSTYRIQSVTQWSVGVDDSDSDKFKISNSPIAAPGNGDLMTITTSGDLGIGTTSPVSILNLETSGSNNEITLESDYNSSFHAGALVLKTAPSADTRRALGTYLASRPQSKEWFIGTPYVAAGNSADYFTVSFLNGNADHVRGGATESDSVLLIKAPNSSETGATIKNNVGNSTSETVALYFKHNQQNAGAILSGRDDTYDGTGPTSDSNLQFYTSLNNGNNERMRIDSSGNVGIGTTSPAARLDVTGTGLDGSADNSPIKITTSSGSGAGIELDSSAVTNGGNWVLFAASDSASIGPGGFGIWDNTNNIYRLAISSSGNVGVGETSPDELLHTSGALRIDGAKTGAETQGLVLSDEAGYKSIQTYDSEPLTLNPLGSNVGIGTTNPQRLLDLTSDTEGSLALRTHNASNFSAVDSYRSRGTASAPTAIGSADSMLKLNGFGYDGSSYTGQVQIALSTRQAWTGSAKGTKITFETTENDTTSREERMRIDHDGNVGIGTASPLSKLHAVSDVNDSIAMDVFDSGSSVSAGNLLLRRGRGTKSSPSGVLAGDRLGFVGAYGYRSTATFSGAQASIEFNAEENFTGTGNGTNIQFETTPVGSIARLERMRIDSAGDVGIGTTNPTYKLHVVGSAGKTTGTAWTSISDRRLKDIQGDYEYGLEAIMKLNTVRFNYSEGNELGLPSDNDIVGFIAQEVQQAIPDAVTVREDGFLELNVDPIHWALVNATQEQQGIIEKNISMMKMMESGVETNSRKIASLESELEKVKEKNNNLEKRLGQMEEFMCSQNATLSFCNK